MPRNILDLSNRSQINPKQTLSITLILFAVLGFFHAFSTPIWAFYDETTHYEYIYFLRENNRRPTKGEAIPGIYDRFTDPLTSYDEYQEQTDPCEATAAHCLEIGKSGWQFDELPGYYMLNAAAWRTTGAQSVIAEVRTSRILSVLLSMLVGVMAYSINRVFMPRKPYLAVATALLIGITTGYLTTMSSLNNDVGAVFAVSCMVLASVLLIEKPTSLWPYVLWLAALGLCLLMKSTSLLGLPVGLAALFLAHFQKQTLLKLAVMFVPVGALLIIAVLLFLGDATMTVTRAFDQTFAISGGVNLTSLTRSFLAQFQQYGAAGFVDPLVWLFVSYWSGIASGVPSYTTLMNGIVLVFSLAAVYGLGRWWFSHPHPETVTKHFILMEVVVILAFLMHLMRIQPERYIPTARHFLVAVIPLSTLLILGLSGLSDKTKKLLPACFILIIFTMNLLAIVNTQVPYFQRLDFTFLF